MTMPVWFRGRAKTLRSEHLDSSLGSAAVSGVTWSLSEPHFPYVKVWLLLSNPQSLRRINESTKLKYLTLPSAGRCPVTSGPSCCPLLFSLVLDKSRKLLLYFPTSNPHIAEDRLGWLFGLPVPQAALPWLLPQPHRLPQVSQSVPLPSEPGPLGVTRTHKRTHACTHTPRVCPIWGLKPNTDRNAKYKKRKNKTVVHFSHSSRIRELQGN